MPRALNQYANFPYRNELHRARGGIKAQGFRTERLEPGTQIFRVTGIPHSPLPSPNDFQHLAGYDNAMARYRARNTSQGASKARTLGCWWTRPHFITDMKWQSVQQNVSIGSIARVASAVKFAWSDMDHFVTAEVKTPLGLFAYAGRGLDMTEEVDADGAKVKIQLIADPNIDQLYIPGLWQPANVSSWLNIIDVQYIGGDNAGAVIAQFGGGGKQLKRH